MQRRILVADIEHGYERLKSALGNDFELIPATSAKEVEQVLEKECGKLDLLVIGVHFDESRMFDCLRKVKANKGWQDLPVVCVRNKRITVSNAFQEAMEISCQVLGAAAYVDLVDIDETSLEKGKANLEIRRVIERHCRQKK